MALGKYYNETEDFCIINFYNKIDIKLLIAALGRSKGSIRQRAIQLGVVKPLQRLSKEQKMFIDANKNKLSQQEMADAINVKRDAVAWHILYSKNTNG